jgi:hypothetical protein
MMMVDDDDDDISDSKPAKDGRRPQNTKGASFENMPKLLQYPRIEN